MSDLEIVSCSALELSTALSLTACGFGVDPTHELEDDVRRHIAVGELWLLRHDAQSVGYAITRRFFGDTLYLSGIMLEDAYRGKHVCEAVVRAARQPTDHYLALRTASPIMWAAGNRLCPSAWLPHPDTTRVDPELVEHGVMLAHAIGCKNFPHAQEFYGKALYGAQPMHRNEAVQSWWETQCQYHRADAVVCIGRL